MSWIIFILTALHIGKISDAQSLTLGMNATIPVKSSSLELACRFSQLFVSNGISLAKDGQQVTNCLAPLYQCKEKSGYIFAPNQTGVFVIIKNLSREASGTWTCRYTNPALNLDVSSNALNMTVYTIPQGLDITQMPDGNVDLSLISARLNCATSGCTYPPPLIQWLTQDQTVSFPVNPAVTGGSCVLPEQLYTSTLDLQQNTTWSDNSDKALIFSCRIEYPDSTMNLITYGSHTIRFAVRVTEAFIQQNNQNITSTLIVILGEPVTLTCVTGTSRPAPNIGWYIGSWSVGSGTSLTFTPSNMNHNGIIYCQAYNTDPNLKVDSNKPRLFVQVTPEKPFSFHATDIQDKQLSLRWQAGYNGGYTQTFIVEISLDNITWNNVSQISAGNRNGWFTTIIEDLTPGSEYYFRLYAYNINGRGDLADVQLAIRMLKDSGGQSSSEVTASAGIGVGGAVGIGVGGAILGLIAALIAMTIRRQLKGPTNYCFRSPGKTDDTMHPYSNTEMNPQTRKPIYEELNKGNTEPSVYDKITPLDG